jgi:HK97 gp10 family phage protein
MMAEIRGMKELKDGFKELGQRMEANAVTAVVLGANAYKNDVQAGSPYKTGTLRRSIHVSDPETKGNQVIAFVGTDLPYAARQEYGFADTDSRGRVYNQAARPYFRPPLDQNKDKYISIIKGALLR